MRSRAQAGLALVEFAIVLPLLMMLLIGLIEVGRYMWYSIQVGNAAHAGAEYGALPGNAGDLTGMATVAKNDGQKSITNITATAQNVCSCWTPTTPTPAPSASPATPAPPSSSACGQSCANGGRQVTYVQVTAQGTISTLFNYRALGFPSSWTVTRVALIRAVPK